MPLALLTSLILHTLIYFSHSHNYSRNNSNASAEISIVIIDNYSNKKSFKNTYKYKAENMPLANSKKYAISQNKDSTNHNMRGHDFIPARIIYKPTVYDSRIIKIISNNNILIKTLIDEHGNIMDITFMDKNLNESEENILKILLNKFKFQAAQLNSAPVATQKIWNLSKIVSTKSPTDDLTQF